MGNILKSGGRKKTIIGIIAVVGVLALAAGIGVLAQFLVRQFPQQPERPSLPASVSEVQDLRNSGGSPEEIQQKLNEALKNSSNDKNAQYLLYIQQGHAFVDQKNWTDALAAYEKAEALQATMETAELIAGTAAKAGDSQKAIDYYKKAIERVSDKNPMADSLKESYQEKIRVLQEQS